MAPWEKENYAQRAQEGEAAVANNLPITLFILSIEMSVRQHLNTVLSQSTKLVGCTMYSHRKQKAFKPNGDDSNCLVNLCSVGTQENPEKNP